ncbi:sulfur carrier protein ThiS [Thermogemmata fonticola]|jgi:thiazole synthase|uniref:Thiazole synthase n=1 Tax=Thermogemmata fonticola TaxID=2755323 RepID=A0A7V9ABB6_9BACT|nr:sulfur carrier protein ThiS [Thermogemmata fonticola]MBA2225863.1 sulfur carrier protein ThiS [Thermogemmata fonticola]
MLRITLNAEQRHFPKPLTVAELLRQLGKNPAQVAVEVNRCVVPRHEHESYWLRDGDVVEIVTLVGGGSGASAGETPPEDRPLKIGPFTFRSRLFTGTGKYASYELMRQCLAASGCEVTTVAVRRERLFDKEGKSLLDYLNLERLTILPNTAGCYSAEDAIRHARLARELLANLGNPGAQWVKLECLADPKTLLPDPIETLRATEQLVAEGFLVLVYTSDDPVLARRLKQAGAASVMPAGSPIGSGQGILNPNNIRICLEYLKDNDPDYPVIVDAGVGTASDVSVAMELGCDGVLLNTAIALAKDPLRMAWAVRYACEAGRLAYLAGRIPKRLYANASSPTEGLIHSSR